MTIRWASPADYDDLGVLMFDAIHGGASPYSPAQRRAWLPAPNTGLAWQARLAAQDVAMFQIGPVPVGFVTLRPDGYVDLAFVRAEARGKAVFRALLATIEQRARERLISLLFTHASLMAEPAFAASGFTATAHETVTRDGQSLARTRMEKPLNADR